MTNLKITTLNGEWMNNWFNGDGSLPKFKPTFQELGSTTIMNTDKTATKLSKLIKGIDADVYGIQEGPSEKNEMLLFISTYLDDKYSCEIGLDGSAQKIYVLYKKSFFDSITSLTHAYPKWKFDNNGDYQLEDGKFTRTPVEIKFVKDGHVIRIVVTHFKSLFINQGKEMWTNPDPAQKINFIKLSLVNRRRITMEAVELRSYIDETLDTYPNSIIMGDVNDGPGRELFENYMLGMDITSELLGSTYYPNNIFSHLLDLKKDYTAIFDDYVDNVPNRKILLDRMLASPSLNPFVTTCNVEYDKFDALVEDPNRRDGRPTDHRPVTLKLSLH
jgi:endonuclease/exonuclease/phosphatase family metal-dependent hydrolase